MPAETKIAPAPASSPVSDSPEDSIKAMGCALLGILTLIYCVWTLFMLTWGFAWSHGSHERSGIVVHLVLGWTYLIGSMICFRIPMRAVTLLTCCLILNAGVVAQVGAFLMSGWGALPFLGIMALWVRLIALRFRAEKCESKAV